MATQNFNRNIFLNLYQFRSGPQSYPTLCVPMDCCTPGFPVTNSQCLLKLMPIESVMPSNHLIPCRPLLLSPSILYQSLSKWVSSLHQMAKVLEFQLQHQTFQWIFRTDGRGGLVCCRSWGHKELDTTEQLNWTELISFRMDWLDLLGVQGTLKGLLQHHSSKASILWRSAFFMVELSHPYMTTGKVIALTRWTFVSKVMSLLFNTLLRFVIAFLPGSQRLLI